MEIETGATYIILSSVTGAAVGRSRTEDKSLFPKRVILLPGGVQAEPWTIERLTGQFILIARGAPTANLDDKVFAILLDVPRPTLWQVRPVPDKENLYTITVFGAPNLGWVAPSEAYNQIAVRPLEGNATEHFRIARAD